MPRMSAAAQRGGPVTAASGWLAFALIALVVAWQGHAAAAALPAKLVNVDGRRLLVDGQPFQIKGVCWNPVPKGGVHPQDLDFPGFVAVDSELMAQAGINAVRTYEAVDDARVLDALWAKGIHVMNTVYSWGGQPEESVVEKVRAVKDHPAILMWLVGNEWNYNGLYYGLPFKEAIAKVSKVVDLIKAEDRSHPVATVHGELPSPDTLKALANVDVWGVNKYSGISFGDLFDSWAAMSSSPMFLGEFGADAYDANAKAVNEGAQAEATAALTEEILAVSSANGNGPCIGGAVFELADEWWKDSGGSPSEHNVGGVSPSGGPYPDMTFNEEWWGLVRYDGTPRQAFRAYARSLSPGEDGSALAVPSRPRLRACGAHRGCRGTLGSCCPADNGSMAECCAVATSAADSSLSEPSDEAEKADERPSTTWRPPGSSVDVHESTPSSHEYVERTDTYVDGFFPSGTDGCDGVGECQFHIRRDAQEFCDRLVDCRAVLLHPFEKGCAGSRGCYTPRRGEASRADLWARAGGRAWVKAISHDQEQSLDSASSPYFFAGFSRARTARRACADRGAQLASPRDTEQLESLQRALDAAQVDGKLNTNWPRNTIWLGGEWNASAGRWEWPGAVPITSFNWGADQPSSKRAQDHEPLLCMILSGEMHDAKDEPGNRFGVMCETPAQIPASTSSTKLDPTKPSPGGASDASAASSPDTTSAREGAGHSSSTTAQAGTSPVLDKEGERGDASTSSSRSSLPAPSPGGAAPVFPPPPEIVPWRCCSYSYVGAAACLEARRLCGPKRRLAMPKSDRERSLLQRAVWEALEEGQLAERWPSNTIWLGGHWQEGARAGWQWDDGSAVDTSGWEPEQLSSIGNQSREPCLVQDLFGVFQDSEPGYTFGVVCEEASDSVVPAEVCSTDVPGWLRIGLVALSLGAVVASLHAAGVQLGASLRQLPRAARLLLLPPALVGGSTALSVLLGPCGPRAPMLPHSSGPIRALLGSPAALLLPGAMVPLWVFSSSSCFCLARHRSQSYSVCPSG